MSQRTKPLIAVDCDDVVANVNDAVRQFVNETYYMNYTAEDYQVTGEYDRYWERIWGVPDEHTSDRFRTFIESGRLRHLEPVPDAIETLRYLKKKYSIAMVTARSKAEVEFTHFWLENNASDVFDDVTFMHLWDDKDKRATKAGICQALGAQYLIDDNYNHCRIAGEAGIQALLFGDYGWNRGHPLIGGIVRMKDWQAVKVYFDGK